MDRYVRVEQQKTEAATVSDNEVRIMAAGKMRNYITYATTILTERDHTSVVLKAMGRAINKSITVCEIIKRRIFGLHQVAEIGSIDITETWEPLEEGLNRLETTRQVIVITITLSKELLDTSLPGYQAPLPESMVKPLQDVPSRQAGGDSSYHAEEEAQQAQPISPDQQSPAPSAAAQAPASPSPHPGAPGPWPAPRAPGHLGGRGRAGRAHGRGRGRARGRGWHGDPGRMQAPRFAARPPAYDHS